MAMELPPRDLRTLLIEDIEEIERAVTAFHGGGHSAYQTIAIQLRNLLVDRDPRSGPLFARVFPGEKLHALKPPEPNEESLESGMAVFTIVDYRGGLEIGGGTAIIQLEFGEALVSLDEWLNDWIVKPEIRIGKLIHEVASKNVAHTDDDRGQTMNTLETALILNVGGQQIEMSRIAIVALGEYVARRTRELLASHES